MPHGQNFAQQNSFHFVSFAYKAASNPVTEKMKSIVITYPDFRELPKGVRQLLVLSETLFFEEVVPTAGMAMVSKPVASNVCGLPLYQAAALRTASMR
ncbi:MAG TPA: hypothetical protein VGN23_04965 [Verrucomicrobiae bacterium]|jgi:hypothetical protein